MQEGGQESHNSIHNFWTTKICAFSKTAQSRFASIVFEGVLGPLKHIWQCPCMSSAPEATHEVSCGPLNSKVSAQKPLQGSGTETREFLGGRKEKGGSPPFWEVSVIRQINDFLLQQTKQKIFESVTRPEVALWRHWRRLAVTGSDVYWADPSSLGGQGHCGPQRP